MEERLASMEKAFDEHTQMGLDLRRELVAKISEMSDHMGVVETQFSIVETVVEGKVTAIDGQLETLRRRLAMAEGGGSAAVGRRTWEAGLR